MTISTLKCVASATLIQLALAAAFTPAWAGPNDYEFKLVQSAIKTGDGAIVSVRLIDKRSGQPVPDAVIFASRMDMQPDGMETMKSAIEPMPSTEPGVYRFKTNLVMEGGWRLSLGAKVQGEPATLEVRLVLKATP